MPGHKSKSISFSPCLSICILFIFIIPLFIFSCQPVIPTEPDTTPIPPEQPVLGPGSADYKHSAVKATTYGWREEQYWIFEPYEPKPDAAPLIVFNHGWLGINPEIYGGWIDHLVRRGNIVVYPRYQVITTPANKVTGYAIEAVKDAIDELNTGSHVRPELDKFAIVGHSLGGVITANMAVMASSEGLPEPKAIMSATPGSTESMGFGGVLSNDLHLIPSSTLLLSISCADDEVVVMEVARRIYNETTRIPAKNKDYITMVSDYHGDPALVADHTAPSAEDRRYDLYNFLDDFGDDRIEMKIISADIPRDTSPNSIHNINSLDYYGFWKLFDALTDAAFYGKNTEYALGNTQEQRFMGKWTDGSLVKELKVGSMP